MAMLERLTSDPKLLLRIPDNDIAVAAGREPALAVLQSDKFRGGAT